MSFDLVQSLKIIYKTSSLRSITANDILPKDLLIGKTRLVLFGSAPNLSQASLDRIHQRDSLLVTVNSSQAGILNQPVPDITFFSITAAGDAPANLLGQAAIQNLSTRHLILIGRKRDKPDKCLLKLAELNYLYQSCIEWKMNHRSAVDYALFDATARAEMGIPSHYSSGVIAIMSLLWAKKILQLKFPLYVCGVSPETIGHSYSQKNMERYHASQDAKVLSYLNRHGLIEIAQ